MPTDLSRLLEGPGGPARRSPPVTVLTMELQRGVIGDLAAFPELAAAVEERGVLANTGRLLRAARASGLPVVHCTAEFRGDGAGTVVNTPLHSAVARRPGHMVAGTPGTELVPELELQPSDLFCARLHGVSPFTGTTLDALLRNLGTRVVVATGVSLNVAVTGLCIEAVGLGYQVVIPRDAVAGVPPSYGDAVLEGTLATLATLTTVDDLVGTVGGDRTGPGE